MNSNSHTVNLEVTHLFHALKWVEWKEEDLPPAKKPVKCLIVGKDTFGFCDRLSFVFAESGKVLLPVGPLILNFGQLDDALRFAKTDKTVMLLVALEAVAEEWEPTLFPKRPGFLVYGQSAKFLEKSMTFFSFSIHNRVKLSVNLRRFLLRFDTQFEITRVQKDIQRGQWNGFRSLGKVILIIPKMPWERRLPFHSLRSRMKPST